MKKMTCISLLRGINVGGQKKILMQDLKALYEQLELKNVITYIQSGNVIFDTRDTYNGIELARKIEQAILRKYDFQVPVIVRTREELQQILKNNPFLREKDIDMDKLHVTFLPANPSQADLENMEKLDFSPDRFIIRDNNAFVFCPRGYGGTKISNSFFESRLKVFATTRNWKTVNKLAEILIP